MFPTLHCFIEATGIVLGVFALVGLIVLWINLCSRIQDEFVSCVATFLPLFLGLIYLVAVKVCM